MAIEYEIDLRSIDIDWLAQDGWKRRMARITFRVSGNHEALPAFEIPILIDAHLKPDAELVQRAWTTLHERLALLQGAATTGENLSKTAVQRDLREG